MDQFCGCGGFYGDDDCLCPPCPYEGTTRDECAMIRERSVAGVSDDIPACPVHGEWREAMDPFEAGH